MIILIETSRNILFSDDAKTGGASKISSVFNYVFLSYFDEIVIFLVDGTNEECKQIRSQFSSDVNRFVTNYDLLHQTLLDNELAPDVAFVNDMFIHRQLQFKRIYNYQYPVIGILHSFAFSWHVNYVKSIRSLMSFNDLYLCPSKDTLTTLKKCGIPDTSLRIFSLGACDLDIYKPIMDKSSLRQQYQVSEEKIICLILGRVSPSSKMDLLQLFHVLPIILDQVKNIEFYVVGAIDDKDYIEELKVYLKQKDLTHAVKWEHQPNHANIHHYFQLSDIFISLSDFCGETFGLTIMEAMCCGLPAIVSNFAGYKQHLKDEDTGFYVNTYHSIIDLNTEFYCENVKDFGLAISQSVAMDMKKLVTSVIDLAKNKQLRNEIGAHARAVAVKRFSFLQLAESFKSVFKDVQKRQQSYVDVESSINQESVFSILCHQPTCVFANDVMFNLTKDTKELLAKNKSVFFFEQDLKRFKLINIILFLLNKDDLSLLQLQSMLRFDSLEVNANILFLMKQGLIKIVTL